MGLKKLDWTLLAAVFIVTVCIFAGPVLRAFYRVEINYNEGWNAYNALLALHHNLYPARYAWTTVNYPFLSFYLIGNLSRLGVDPVLIGRLLSFLALLVCCTCVALIVKELTRCGWAALFAFAFALTLFNAFVPHYVIADDPQMLAQALAMLALLFYLRSSAGNRTIPVIALLFVLSVNIKQNLIAAPLTVLIDLLITSRAKAARFVFFGVILLALLLGISVWIEGPFYIAQLLTPRRYLLSRLVIVNRIISLATFVFILLALFVRRWCDLRFRIVIVYAIVSLIAGIFFSGGEGVALNIFFDCFLADSIMLGVIIARFQLADLPRVLEGSDRKWVVRLLLIVPLLVWVPPLILHQPYEAPYVNLAALPAQAKEFTAETDFLRSQTGPVLCESLLRCYYAGKPYVYDPFNATSLIRLGKLDGQQMFSRIENKEYSAIQADLPVRKYPRPYERFPDAFMDAVDRYYRVAVQDHGCVIYVPR